MCNIMRFLAVAAFALFALFALFAHAARADAIPPPAEHSDLQKKLIGVWQEEQCFRPKYRGHACQLRTFAFGEDTVGLLAFGCGAPNSSAAEVQSSAWSELTSIGDVATVSADLGGRKEMKIVFHDADTMTIVGDEHYPDANFKKVANTAD